MSRELILNAHLGGLELVFKQAQGFEDDPIHIHFGEFGAAGPRKVQKIIDDLGCAEGLACDLFEHSALLLVSLKLFREQLGIGRNHRQWRVDFVRDACSQQTDGRQFVRLRKLGFEVHAISDVVHDNQPAHHTELLGDQRRDGNVHSSGLACGDGHPEFVQVVNARALSDARELSDKLGREYLAQRTVQRLPPGQRIHNFHLRVPGFDAVIEIYR